MSKLALKAGTRVTSAVSDAQLMVIKIPAGEYALNCGGAPMLGPGQSADGAAVADPADTGECLMGKRYVNPEETVEMLCTKAGAGTVTIDGTPLQVKQAKQLPSSD